MGAETPQTEIEDFGQPCRARAPFVRFADISPADGGINPYRGAFRRMEVGEALGRWRK